MTVSVDWFDNDERIILFTMTEKWTWEELAPAIEESKTMCRAVYHDQRVHPIVDLRIGDMSIPRNIIKQMRGVAMGQPSNAGATIIVTKSGFVSNIFNLVSKASPDVVKQKMRQHFDLVITFEEAEKRIRALIETPQSATS